MRSRTLFSIFIFLFAASAFGADPGIVQYYGKSLELDCTSGMEFPNEREILLKRPEGLAYFFRYIGTGRPISEKPEFSVSTFNVRHGAGGRERSLSAKEQNIKDLQLAETILATGSKIVVLQEMHDYEYAKNFGHYRLKNFSLFFMPASWDTADKHIAIYVHNSLGADIELRSLWDVHHHYFGADVRLYKRDMPVLIFRDPANGGPKKNVEFVLIGAHFKARSPFFQAGTVVDPYSEKKKKAEYSGVKDVVQALQSEFGEEVEIWFLGDLNNDMSAVARSDGTLEYMRGIGFENAFDVMGTRLAHRYTFVGVNESRNVIRRQYDNFFQKKGRSRSFRIKSVVVGPHRRKNGEAIPAIQSWEDEAEHFSDHYPLTVVLERTKN